MIDTHILETASSDVETHRLVACLKYEKKRKKNILQNLQHPGTGLERLPR